LYSSRSAFRLRSPQIPASYGETWPKHEARRLVGLPSHKRREAQSRHGRRLPNRAFHPMARRSHSSAAATSGKCRRLAATPACWSRIRRLNRVRCSPPDGKRLAFTSTRTGGGDIYVVTIATGDLVRLTFDDVAELVTGWSADGQWIYFSSNSHELSGVTDVYRVPADGGTPMPVAADSLNLGVFRRTLAGG
jgi:hypothetical protein